MKFYIKVFTTVMLLLPMAAVAQDRDILDKVRAMADKKQYDDALLLLQSELNRNANDYDLLMMEVRVLGWSKNFQLAERKLSAIQQQWNTEETSLLAIDLAYWSQSWPILVERTDLFLTTHGINESVLYKQAIAFTELQQFEKASDVVTAFLKLNRSHAGAIILEQRIRESLMRNSLLVSYRFTSFDSDLSDWHNLALSYTRTTSAGPISMSLYGGDQFDEQGIQVEADWYPRISKQSYGYVSVAYSDAIIFPGFRINGEYFLMLPYAFEVSAGARYFEYDDVTVNVFTGSLGKYFSDYWISYRPLLTEIKSERSWTHTFHVRRYWSNRFHYFGIIAGIGNAPVQFVTLQEIQRLNASRAGAEFQYPFSKGYLIKIQSEFQHEEFIEGSFRNRVSAELSLIKRF